MPDPHLDLALAATPPVVLALEGDYDASSLGELSDLLAEAVAGSDGDLVLDASHVTFMCAASLAPIEVTIEVLGAEGRTLVVRAPSRPVVRLLVLAGLAHLVVPAPSWRYEL